MHKNTSKEIDNSSHANDNPTKKEKLSQRALEEIEYIKTLL